MTLMVVSETITCCPPGIGEQKVEVEGGRRYWRLYGPEECPVLGLDLQACSLLEYGTILISPIDEGRVFQAF